MTAEQTKLPRGAVLVGSVNLPDAETVFRTASAALGDRLLRMPDGETGERLGWISWQAPAFQRVPQLVEVHDNEDRDGRFRLMPGARTEEIVFGPLGYAAVALESYGVFSSLKHQGHIPEHVKFQVSIPTPLALIHFFIVQEDRDAVEPAFEARMAAEIDEICQQVAHEELAIQWDVAMEVAILEGGFGSYGLTDGLASESEEKRWREVTDRLVRIGVYIPGDVELGYHLCYGDAGHQHFKEPVDMGLMVRLANDVLSSVSRPVTWIHMPVPRDRTDRDYFAPLADMNLPDDTELYLGLVHLTDGVDGTLRRIETAQSVVPDFAVATECGFGRRPAETMHELLEIHAAVSAPIP